MPKQVVNMAQIQCSQALPPGLSVLTVLPANRVNSNSQPAANVMDGVPLVNVMTFGVCTSATNPAAVAAKAAGSPGAPCVPATVPPWSPGSADVKIAMFAALNDSSKLTCALGMKDCISVKMPGQTNHNIS